MKKLILFIIATVSIGLLPILVAGYDQYTDFIEQQIPFMLETKRMLSSGSPWWSWNTYIGDNFIGGYSFYTITSPFVWLICLFPSNSIILGIIIALYLKFIAAGCTAYIYLKRMNINNDLSILGGLCYCFSSFFITNLYYYHFCEPIIVFPIMLIAIENILSDKRYAMTFLSLSTFIVVFINYYFSISSLLLGALYFVARYINLFPQLKANKQIYQSILKCALSVILGIALSAIILAPTILHVVGSGRTALHSVLKLGFIKYDTELLLQFIKPKLFEGSETSFCFMGWNSNSFFIPIIGGLPIIMIFRNWNKIRSNNQINWLMWLIIGFLFISLTPINGLFTGFTKITYTRWFYGLLIFLILLTCHLLSSYKIEYKTFFIYIISSLCLIVIAKLIDPAFGIMNGNSFNITFNNNEFVEIILCLTNIFLLAYFIRTKCNIARAQLLVMISAILTLSSSIYFSFNSEKQNAADIFETYIFNNDLKNANKYFKFRIDYKADYRNLALLSNHSSIIGFHSISNKKLNDFRSLITNNITSPAIYIKKNRVSTDALLSTKDFIDFGSEPQTFAPMDYKALTPIETTRYFTRYSFKYYIPMGFCYDSYITQDEFNDYLASCPIDSVKPMLQCLVINKNDVTTFSRLLKHTKIASEASIDSLVNERRKYTATNFVGDTKGLTMKTNFNKERVVFTSVVADPGFSATIDGNPTKIYSVNLGMSAIIVPCGKHFINFIYKTPGLNLGYAISASSLLILILLALYERRIKTS